jgi:hypothetical protein
MCSSTLRKKSSPRGHGSRSPRALASSRPDASSASNARTLVVLPLISNVIVAVIPASPPVLSDDVHELTLTGARLGGADVRLIIDGVAYQVGTQSAAASFVYRLGRQLSPGVHTVAVNVDGFTSRSVEVVV